MLALLGTAGAGLLTLPIFGVPTAAFFILVTAAVVVGLRLHGWLGGPRRLAKIAWLPDGTWRLRDARHTPVTARLRADSRIGARWLWLRWDAGSAWAGQRSMLLVHGDVPAADLRRLLARLRLEGSRTTAEFPVRDDAF